MPSRCSVKGCYETKKLHVIPSKAKFPNAHNKWVIACGREPTAQNLDLRVCSNHFKDTDFIDPLKKGKIRDGSIPSNNLGDPATCSFNLMVDPSVPGRTYNVMLSQINLLLAISIQFATTAPSNQSNDSNKLGFKSPSEPRKEEKLNSKCSKLKQHLMAARRMSKICRVSTQKYRTRLRTALKRRRDYLKGPRQIKKLLRDAISKVHDFYQTKLKTIFTGNQITRLLSKARSFWNSEDIARGIALRYQANTYDQLVKRKFPFPNSRTLRRWTKKIKFTPGPPSASILTLLTEFFRNATKLKRQAVLSFDEVGIDARLDYDKEEDKIYAGKANMTVFMVRGLFESWKQIVAYDFDGTVTVEKLTDLIAALEKCGIQIRAVTSDMGGKNQSLWKKLNIKVTKSKDGKIDVQNTIRSPVNHNLIYFFADVPHLIKSLRNNLLNKGFTLSGGQTIGIEDFRYMKNLDGSDLSTTWKVTDRHLNVNDQQKQRVHLATELLSGSVATFFDHVLKRKPEADFIRTVNDSFDVLNSRHLNETLGTKMPYGLSLPLQNSTLNKMAHEISNLRVGDSNCLYPFQKGYLLTIQSFKDLFEDLRNELSIKYILAHRLNQDILENAFSVMRGIGGFNLNPTAVDACKRIKLLMLSATSSLSSGTVVKQDGDTKFITGELLSKLLSTDASGNVQEVELTDEELTPSSEQLDENGEPRTKVGRIEDMCEDTATQILAGFIAFKLKRTNLIASDDECASFSSQSWYLQLRRRGYSIPSKLLQDQVSVLEKEFRKFHGEVVSTQCGVLNGFTLALQRKYPEYDGDVVALFCKTRTYIRIKSMNKASFALKLQQKKATADKIQRLQDRYNMTKLMENNVPKIVEPYVPNDYGFLYEGNGFPWCNDIGNLVKDVFGVDAMSGIQQTATNIVLSSLDCLLIMPTGSGKSLVYQACASFSGGVTLVVSPLVSLIEDQVTNLSLKGVAAVRMLTTSTATDDDNALILNPKLIYTSPEMLAKSKRLQDYLSTMHNQGRFNRIVVDEAHCLIEWGKEFRTDFDAVSRLKADYPTVPILAVTATVTKSMERELCLALGIPNGIVLRDANFRGNLVYGIECLASAAKNERLKTLLQEVFSNEVGIVYCCTIRECENVVKFLTTAGITCHFYHAKMSTENRNAVQKAWYSGEFKIIVATTAFGMGVNNLSCKFVIHYTLSLSMINYQQETGRAGRDGGLGHCITLLAMQDVFRLLSMVSLSEGGRSNLYEVLSFAITQKMCRRSMLKLHFGYPVADDEECSLCDNCKTSMISLDVSLCVTEVFRILEVAKKGKEKLTLKNLVDILLGKCRKITCQTPTEFKNKDRSFFERLVIFLLSERYLSEEFVISGRFSNCYVVKGARDDVNSVELSQKV